MDPRGKPNSLGMLGSSLSGRGFVVASLVVLLIWRMETLSHSDRCPLCQYRILKFV